MFEKSNAIYKNIQDKTKNIQSLQSARETLMTELQKMAEQYRMYLLSKAEPSEDFRAAEAENMQKQKAIDQKLLRANLEHAILYNNYKIVYASEVAPIVSDTLNRYEGKRAGDKTRQKISDDFRKQTGCSLFFGKHYSRPYITIRTLDPSGYYAPSNLDIELESIIVNGDYLPIEIDNIIQPITPDMFRPVDTNPLYHADPATAARAIIKAYKQASAAYEKCEALREKYNNLIDDLPGTRHADFVGFFPSSIF